MAESFWSDSGVEPKRAYRWVLLLGGIPQWLCKKVSKPSFAVSETEHTYLNHKFYYPGRVEWNTVTVTLADPVAPDAAKTMVDIIKASGYSIPDGALKAEASTISKAKAVTALGTVKIQQLGSGVEGKGVEGNIIETWELVNAWVKDVKFGELDYESDDMVDVELELRYDYAKLTGKGIASPIEGLPKSSTSTS